YRSPDQDRRAWQKAFHTHMLKTMPARTTMMTDPLGAEAFEMMLIAMNKYKAPPGFSNHTKGHAVDFSVREVLGGAKHAVDLGPSTSQKPSWRQSAFWRWLGMYAEEKYGFSPLATEEWHWDHPD